MDPQPTEVDSEVRSKFSVKDSFQLAEGEVEYKVEYRPDSRVRFEELHRSLLIKGFTPLLVGTREEAALIVRKKQAVGPSRSRVPVILGLLTLVSVLVFAIFQRESYQQFASGFQGNVVVFTYGGAVIAVLAAHELGHRYFSKRSGT
ncbi:MAG: hypothetical protein ACHQYR_03045, partial [Candidatus Gagatemarchaeaceae archaeon]